MEIEDCKQVGTEDFSPSLLYESFDLVFEEEATLG
jgi:hypothetical protein